MEDKFCETPWMVGISKKPIFHSQTSYFFIKSIFKNDSVIKGSK